MNDAAAALSMAAKDRRLLEQWARSTSAPHRVVIRAKALLLATEGGSNGRIAATVDVSRPTVLAWRDRFGEEGVDSVFEMREGRGRKPTISARRVKAIVHATLHRTPPGATPWSCRTMAKAQGVSRSTVQRIWDAHGLQPHRVETFKLSTDPAFVEKLTDVVGLYMNPPEKAVVLCVDEKSHIQALDRTQPGLPMKKGRCGTLTHDYKRHGTTTLFAALNMLTGQVIGECHGRHRHQEFLKFLRQLHRAFPSRLDLHLILDNYGTHKHPTVRAWLAAHPRFTLHFTPYRRIVAQPRRELVQPAHAETHPPRGVLQCRRTRRRHQRLPPALQRQPPTLCLDRDGRYDSREGWEVQSYSWDTPLAGLPDGLPPGATRDICHELLRQGTSSPW